MTQPPPDTVSSGNTPEKNWVNLQSPVRAEIRTLVVRTVRGMARVLGRRYILREFLESAAERESQRLAEQHNHSHPWPPRSEERLPTGPEIGVSTGNIPPRTAILQSPVRREVRRSVLDTIFGVRDALGRRYMLQEFLESAAERESQRLAEQHNHGQAWPPLEHEEEPLPTGPDIKTATSPRKKSGM
jgi:hypothetical protein